ncbi:NAD-dependent epimerase/dehydratase family protein [Nocardia aurea]|uniref:NAD-dependent epimerase/dehydratase family protein n=1 Tax=Nocardia aurea TaxID=2144174 RepID=UPI000D68E229|nr:NAD-dependent epimerase/dehydratase family protein [Nocardia aurea]
MAILITGAAGFIGAHVVAALRNSGCDIVATDILPRSDAVRLSNFLDEGLCYVPGDLFEILPGVMDGVHQVWHFAANADIPLGAHNTSIDVRESILLTHRLLESMRHSHVRSLIFPSTSGVYGRNSGLARAEHVGPFLPASLHAAGKLAAEGLISAYCSTFGLQGCIFRLGNVVGGMMGRGIIYDFICKLSKNPEQLPVMGNGRQRKSFVLVDDAIEGMRQIGENSRNDGPYCDIFNIAAGGSVSVVDVAGIVSRAMGLRTPELAIEGTSIAWPGDQPVIELDIGKALASGWAPRYSATEAVRVAANRMVADLGISVAPQ